MREKLYDATISNEIRTLDKITVEQAENVIKFVEKYGGECFFIREDIYACCYKSHNFSVTHKGL